MGITITVDLGASSPSDIARAAKFMLEFAGYQAPSVAQSQAAHDAAVDRADRPSGTSAPRGDWKPGDPISDSYTSRFGEDRAKVIQGMQSTLVGARGSLGEEIADAATVFSDSVPRKEISVDVTTAFAAGVGGNVTVSKDLPLHPEFAAALAVGTDGLHREIVATLPPPPPGIEVDAQGVPWDTRIHAGSRAKIADGTWRQRRNLDPVIYKQVMDELRATMGVERRAPTPPAPPAPVEVFAPHPPVPPIPVAPPVPTTPEVPPVPFAGSAVPPAPPTSGTPPVPASAGAAMGASPGSASPGGVSSPPTFPQLMQRITAAFTAKTLDQPRIIAAVQKVGLSSLPMLASRPDLVADVATELGIAL